VNGDVLDAPVVLTVLPGAVQEVDVRSHAFSRGSLTVSALTELRPSPRTSICSALSPALLPPPVDAAVNTEIVMDGFTFRCTACSKPPKAPVEGRLAFAPVVPGPRARQLISKLDRTKWKRQPGQQKSGTPERNERNTVRYRGSRFDGLWVAEPDEDSPDPAEWLTALRISQGNVVMGDGSTAQLMHSVANDSVLLCGGELRLQDDGILIRVGRSGIPIPFVQVGAGESDENIDEEFDSASASLDVASSACEAPIHHGAMASDYSFRVSYCGDISVDDVG